MRWSWIASVSSVFSDDELEGRDAGLVDVRPVGQRRIYGIRPEGLASVTEFLSELWPTSLMRLKGAVESRTRHDH